IAQMEYTQIAENYNQLISQAKECGKAAGIAKNNFDKALFPVFAWIDETLLATGWDQKQEWVKNSLQKKYFNTTSAGAEFFTKLEKVKEEEKDILEVFNYCLVSGFKGSLYEPYNEQKLNGIKLNTYKQLVGDEVANFEISDILFPDAGNIVLNKRLKRKRWKGYSNFISLFVLLPILLFLALFYFFNKQLVDIINNSGLLM
ncbi:MAG: DotU/TssL family secretion system protein, partial [Desulfobacteraceae bacterium]|nr:DotU/TssL family secretion system protein [Desulfobacteraceae bacterium]